MGEEVEDLKGRAKEAAGKLTEDKDLEREGKADQVGAKVKGILDDAKEKVGDVVDKVKDKLSDDK